MIVASVPVWRRLSAARFLQQNDLGRGVVQSHRNVIDDGEPHQSLHINVMRHGRQRINEENQRIDLCFGNQRPGLLVAAERAA
jgi:hypothetical protein